jgi:hypothetical protein
MNPFFLILPFLIFSFSAAFSQGKISINYPDSIKKSKIYFSPYAKYSNIPSVNGIVKIGGNYDSLLNYERSDFDNFEDDDSIGTLLEKQKGLKLIVDTAQEIDQQEYFIKSDKDYGLYSSPKYITYMNSTNKKTKFRCNRDTIITFKAYPVYVVNITQRQKAIYLKSSYIEITQEAIDKDGKWQPIEQTKTFNCGVGFGWRGLKANEYLVTSIYKYKGDYKTLLRIKLVNGRSIYYSEPFRGSINYSQMNKNKIRYIDGLPYEKGY